MIKKDIGVSETVVSTIDNAITNLYQLSNAIDTNFMREQAEHEGYNWWECRCRSAAVNRKLLVARIARRHHKICYYIRRNEPRFTIAMHTTTLFPTRFLSISPHILVVAMLASSAILWDSNTADFQVLYIDAEFLCCSAICSTDTAIASRDITSSPRYRLSYSQGHGPSYFHLKDQRMTASELSNLTVDIIICFYEFTEANTRNISDKPDKFYKYRLRKRGIKTTILPSRLKSALFDDPWRRTGQPWIRVVLEKVQVVSKRDQARHKALKKLYAKAFVCLTGTPTHNLGRLNGFQQSSLSVMMLLDELTKLMIIRRYFSKDVKELSL